MTKTELLSSYNNLNKPQQVSKVSSILQALSTDTYPIFSHLLSLVNERWEDIDDQVLVCIYEFVLWLSDKVSEKKELQQSVISEQQKQMRERIQAIETEENNDIESLLQSI